MTVSNCSEYITGEERRQRIREEAIRRRDRIPPKVRSESSRTICTRVIDFIEARAINAVMLYLNMRSEVETRDLLVYLLRTNKVTLAPAIEAKRLVPRRIADAGTQFVRHRYGMYQPNQDVCPEFPLNQIELIIVPGVAFDLKKYRIGYGGGYYDRFLPNCPNAISMGLAFKEQVIQDTMPRSWDVALHNIISEKCD
ncbi:MAG: 5-formyltetrahydrofolate cyclo-ligase [Candidatus Poribacteria bacterium]|nr:5-formyltetrahydrofolate cyclo-ligase [Candidatus Poribacteria bacterium]